MRIAWVVVLRAVLLAFVVSSVATFATVQLVTPGDQTWLLVMVVVGPLLTVGLSSALAVLRPSPAERRSAVGGPAVLLLLGVVAILLSGDPGAGALALLGGAAGAGLGWWSLSRRLVPGSGVNRPRR